MPPLMPEKLARRAALRLMGASMALSGTLGGLAGCDDPGGGDERLIPAAIAPPGIIPGRPDSFATALDQNGSFVGILVTHRMGRPLKIEGNPAHPSSLGGTDAPTQATILDFYDPDRAGGILQSGAPTDENALRTMLAGLRARLAQSHGAGFRLLSGPVASPTIAAALDGLLAQYPEARWHQYSASPRDAALDAALAAYGRPVDVLPNLAQVDVLLAIDSDLLDDAPGHLRWARDFAARRNPVRGAMNRVYAIEPVPSLVGAAADHRFIVGPADMPVIAAGLAAGVLGQTPPAGPSWLKALVADLLAHRGRALVHVGPHQPAELHVLAHAMNEALGGRGQTFSIIDAVAHRPTNQAGSMRALINDMQAGHVSSLVIIDCNAVYSAPGFAAALRGVPTSINFAPSLDETAQAATWHVPLVHPLEAWGDGRGHDGTAAIIQPQSVPLYHGWSLSRGLSLLAGDSPVRALDAVRQNWRDQLGGDAAWRDALMQGVVPNTAAPISDVPFRPGPPPSLPAIARTAPPELDLLVRPDPHIGDGARANNGWLQELPKPFTKLVWDNPLLLSPGMAARLKLHPGDVVRVARGDVAITLPIWPLPGLADDVAVATLGFGRRLVGEVGRGVGTDITPLRGAAGPIRLSRTGDHIDLATTEHHNPMEPTNDDLVRRFTLAAYQQNPAALRPAEGGETLYNRRPGGAVGWGMSIDQNACIGCNACVTACQAENNIPVVGRTEVLAQREMHWLRIDRHWSGNPANPATDFQPVLCMHCESAPCETVCPVGATMHDQEGLNVMVYNRCVGTRFCSNNCPYKVRRFNYLAFTREDPRPDAAWNPEVTVRARGVMEKCSFCLQRIAAARIAADQEGDPALEGAVVTACQAACPTRAITFGDAHDPASEVAKRKASKLNYVLLPEQTTRPRVSYEARIRNPNPGIVT